MDFNFGPYVIAVTHTSQVGALAEVRRRLRSGIGFALATLNLDHLVKLAVSEGFVRAYAVQDIIVADGNPIVWLSRLAGREVELVPGSDLVLPLVRVAAEEAVPVALVGSTPAALERAAARLRREAPGLEIVTRIAPPFGFDPGSAAAGDLLHEVAASGARLCLLALGAPKQEALAARGRAEVPHVGFASIGAGLDFLAGTQQRAPRIMRQARLEWAWRMATSPLRLGPRYARCAVILPGYVRAALAQRRERAALD